MSLCKSILRKPKVVVKDATPVDTTTKITSVTQKAATKFEVTLSKAVSSAAITNFSIVRDESNAIVAVNTADVDSKDATKVSLTTYESLTDGKSYTVTYTASDEAKTQSSVQITVTDGTIADLNLTPLTITAGKATTIKYQTLDKNSVILSEKSIGSRATGIEVNTTNNDGYYTSAGDLYLANVDESATIVVSYHTYKYDSNGQETGIIEKSFTVKAVDSASVAKYDYTIAKSAPYNWATTTKSTQIAMEDTTYNAYIRISDANGDALSTSQSSEYSVESSNNNILIAAGTADGAIALTPVAQGSAYLIVSKDGKNVASLPVSVVAKRVLTTVKLGASSVTVATDSAIGAVGTGYLGQSVISVQTLDQYGVDITTTDTGTVTTTSKPASAVDTNVTPTTSAGKVIVSSSSAPVGTYGYKITFSDVYGNQKSAVFSVRVAAPGAGASTIKLAAAETDGTNANGTVKTIDTTVNGGSLGTKNIDIYAVTVGGNGVIANASPFSSTVSVSAIKVTGSDGTVYAATGAGIVTSQAIDATALQAAMDAGNTNGKLTIKVRSTSVTNNIRKYLPAGVYTVTYTVKDATNSSNIVTKTYSTQFTVKDSQPVTTVKVVEPNIGSADILTSVFNNTKYATFSYDGISLGNTVTTIKAVIGAKTTNGTKATVKSVVAQIPVSINETTYTIDTVVPVNVTFSGLSGSFTNVKNANELKMYI